jgi:hypothetical protein
VENFLKEFRNCFFNNIDNKEKLKPYISLVYYKVAYYGVLFKEDADKSFRIIQQLQSEISKKHIPNSSGGNFILISDHNDYFNKSDHEFVNHRYYDGIAGTLEGVLANIRNNGLIFNIIDLVDINDLSSNDFFFFTGEYKSENRRLKKPNMFNSFEELFINKKDIEKCIEALMMYRPERPLINKNKIWIGSKKDKGLIVAWIERMETMSIPKIRRLNERALLVELLNKYFKDLDMGNDARVFGNIVKQSVKNSFIALLPE